MDKWQMYMEIQQLMKQGFSKKRIAERLGISRTTLYRYLKKSPEDMALWMSSTKSRTKKLDFLRERMISWLRKYPDLSAAQVYDWLKERETSIQVSESTVRSYVRELRKMYHLPKSKTIRTYEAIPDPPMGEQAQVDFGETKQKNSDGKEIKLTFITFVLSHSRYKYMEWLDRPFTTRDVIRAHENAFEFYGGIPHELVYDQDSLIVVSENAGDLILTAEFEAYRRERDLTLRVCRKADPESKGRIENVVGYVKHNFAKHRCFHHIDSWNEQAMEWLERTGNSKVHNTTKKRPVEVFIQEKHHLRPISRIISQTTVDATSITRTVRKDNTILYKSNRYSVPLGTYLDHSSTVHLRIDREFLLIMNSNGIVIAKHRVDKRKGQLVQDRTHTRDRTEGIDGYMTTVAKKFSDVELAHSYLIEIRKFYPRYMRDQLQMISKPISKVDPAVLNEALQECVQRKLYSASEFQDMVDYINRQRQINMDTSTDNDKVTKPLDPKSQSIVDTKPSTRDISQYVSILEGESA